MGHDRHGSRGSEGHDRRRADHLGVERLVTIDHVFGIAMLLGMDAAGSAIEPHRGFRGFREGGDIIRLGQHAAPRMEQAGHAAPAIGGDRRAAGQRFGHHQASRQ